MKAETLKNTKEFEPITIILTIENRDELLCLYHKLNTSVNTSNNNINENCTVPRPKNFTSSDTLFHLVDKIMQNC